MRRMRFVLVSLLIAIFLAWVTGFAPSGSFVEIHSPTGEPAEISFSGICFTIPQKEGTLAFPIQYGKARFRVRFSDGRTAWIEFFHADVGTRNRVDFYLSHAPDSGLINVRELINGSHEIFNGNVDVAKTSEAQPYILYYD